MGLSSARQIPKALCLLDQAIERDPRYGPALAWAALCHTRLCLDDRSGEREADRREGTNSAGRGHYQVRGVVTDLIGCR